MKKKTIALFSLLVLTGLSVNLSFAADYFPKEKEAGGNIVVGGEGTFEDLYIGGGSVSINKEVLGDLFIGAGSISVAGATEEDLFAAGGNINISSPVGDDARLAGGNVTLSAPIGGDLLAAGGTLIISSAATVGGDMWLAGGAVNFSSTVAGGAKIAGVEIYINGRIDGPLDVAAEKLTFGPDAEVPGPIVYYGPKEAVVESGGAVGAVEMREWKEWKRDKRADKAASSFLGFFIFKLLALLVAALVLWKLFGKRVSGVVSGAYARPWASLGWGVLFLVFAPIVTLVLLITVVGAYLGALLGALFLLACILAGVLSVVYTGYVLERWMQKGRVVAVTWRTVLWGILAGGVLALIPFIGWLVIFILFLMTLGSLARSLRRVVEV